LVSKILGHEASAEEISSFLTDCRDIAGDEETYQQEYMCVAIDEATAWLTWEMIVSAEHPDAGKPELYAGGPCSSATNIGRRRDLSVIWVLEKVGDVLWTREVVTMKGRSFAEQDAEMERIFATYQVRRLCKDQTGMGEKPVEDDKRRYGESRVEGLLFTGPVKQEPRGRRKAAVRGQAPAHPAARASANRTTACAR